MSGGLTKLQPLAGFSYTLYVVHMPLIIGIPFAWAHLKLAGLALWPIGRMIVPA